MRRDLDVTDEEVAGPAAGHDVRVGSRLVIELVSKVIFSYIIKFIKVEDLFSVHSSHSSEYFSCLLINVL